MLSAASISFSPCLCNHKIPCSLHHRSFDGWVTWITIQLDYYFFFFFCIFEHIFNSNVHVCLSSTSFSWKTKTSQRLLCHFTTNKCWSKLSNISWYYFNMLSVYRNTLLAYNDSPRSIRVTKKAKIVPIGNPRWPLWPPSGKLIFCFFSDQKANWFGSW